MTAPERNPAAEAAEGVKPDYSRLGFRELQQLAKSRHLPGDGSTIDLVNKLKAYDVQHGLEVDTTVPDGDDEVDLLADDPDPNETVDKPSEPIAPPAPADKPSNPTPEAPPVRAETPTGGGEVASAPPPAGPALPAANDQRGRADLATKAGLVGVGEGHGGTAVRAFRQEFPLGPHEITDVMHFRYIADTHGYARAAGYETKGGLTIGERVGYGVDADGHRTVIYQVPLRRTR